MRPWSADINLDFTTARDFRESMETIRRDLDAIAYDFPELHRRPASCPLFALPVKFDPTLVVSEERPRPRTHRRHLIRKWERTRWRTVPNPNCYLIGGIVYCHPETSAKLGAMLDSANEKIEYVKFGSEIPNPYIPPGVVCSMKYETKA